MNTPTKTCSNPKCDTPAPFGLLCPVCDGVQLTELLMQSYAGNPERYAEMLAQFDRECLRTGTMLLDFARRNGASKLAGLAVKIVDAEKRCDNDGIFERARTLGKYRLNATTTVDAKEAIKKVLVSAIEGMKG